MPTPERTSHAEIIAAARSLLESGGPSAITMQAVAEIVGVRAPSLYKRVRDRDALVSLVAEDAARTLRERLEESDHTLTALAAAYRTFARECPEAFRLMLTHTGDADVLRDVASPVIAATESVVGERHALDAARLVTAWATGFLLMELGGGFRLGGDLDAAFDYGIATIRTGLLVGEHAGATGTASLEPEATR